jgi:TolA-binding protein
MRIFGRAFLKKMAVIAASVFSLLFCACADAEQRAQELYELAVFEEKQFNKEHATELYEEILQKYPETEVAQKARDNLKKIKSESNSPPQ